MSKRRKKIYPKPPARVPSNRLPAVEWSRRSYFWFGATFLVAGIAILYRGYFASHLDRIAGNDGDSRLVAYLLEHWYRVFHFSESWLSPPFFYPVKGVLGYSVTVFLEAIPYSLLRFLGADPWSALEWTLISLSCIGFLSTFLLLTRYLGSGPIWGAVGAFLFCFSNAMYIWVTSPQLFLVLLSPMLVLAVVWAIENWRQKRVLAWIAAIGSAALLSLMFFSEFYSAWFLTLFVGACLVITTLRNPGWIRRFAGSHSNAVIPLLAALGGAAVFMIPFGLTYGGAIREGKLRTVDSLTQNMISPAQLIHVGTTNVLWGHLLSRSPDYSAIDHAHGFTPIFAATLALLTILGFAGLPVFGFARPDPRNILLRSACAAVAVCASLAVIPSAWLLVWHYVPGAKVIRVPGRITLTLGLFAAIAVAAALGNLQRRIARPALRGCLTAFGLVLVAEQINQFPNHDVRRQEQKTLLSAPAMPAGCRVMVLDSSQTPMRRHPIFLQLDAMWIAAAAGVPTMNGYSGLEPPNWTLGDTNAGDYLIRVHDWAQGHALTGLCSYSPDTKTWITDPFRPPYAVGAVGDRWTFKSSSRRISSLVGRRTGDRLVSTGARGYLQFGPLLPARAGSYVARWHGRVLNAGDSPAATTFEVTVANQRIASAPLRASGPQQAGVLAEVPFELSNDVLDLECKTIVGEGVRLEIADLEIRRADTPR